MKKKVHVILATLLIVLFLGGFVGCAEQSTTSSSSDRSSSAPALQPASHKGRFYDLGQSGCYGCHGNGEIANPNLTEAVVTPEDHYVDMSYDSRAYAPVRNQCITCHLVDQAS